MSASPCAEALMRPFESNFMCFSPQCCVQRKVSRPMFAAFGKWGGGKMCRVRYSIRQILRNLSRLPPEARLAKSCMLLLCCGPQSLQGWCHVVHPSLRRWSVS